MPGSGYSDRSRGMGEFFKKLYDLNFEWCVGTSFYGRHKIEYFKVVTYFFYKNV